MSNSVIIKHLHGSNEYNMSRIGTVRKPCFDVPHRAVLQMPCDMLYWFKNLIFRLLNNI